VATFLALGVLFCGRAIAGVSDKAVASRIVLLQQNVMRLQKQDGSWSYPGYPVGATAIAVMALRISGVSAEHPAVQKGVKYIVEHTDKKVYSEGLAPCALEMVGPEKYQNRIRQAAKFLIHSQLSNGAWTYTEARAPKGGVRGARTVYYDNSNTQFAVLGLAAAERCGVSIPRSAKKKATTHWEKTQNADGGWGYVTGTSTQSMTCAGIASLHLLDVSLEKQGTKCGQYKLNPVMADGLNCLARQLSGATVRFGGYHSNYGLYALERVGMLMELKTIGKTDWYGMGANYLLGRQSVGSISEDALALLFLAKGSAPIAIAKWRWGGDWNKDHRDVKEWVEGVGGMLKRKLDWLPAKLDRLDSPAAKASMIFVNGHETFKVKESELEFLRAFLEDGGTVVAEGCCGSKRFIKSFGKIMSKQLFPEANLSFVPLDAKHPVCNSKYALTPEEIAARVLKAGCRKRRLLLLTKDISCALNGESVGEEELQRARRVATNLLVWALRSKEADRKLDKVELKKFALGAEELTLDQLQRQAAMSSRHFHQPFGRLKHRGDWLADPRVFAGISKLFGQREDLPRFDGEVHVSLTSDDLFQMAVTFMTGHDEPNLTSEERINLRTYLQNGGFLLASACCSNRKFDAGFRKLLLAVFPNDELEEVPADDAVWNVPFPCREAGVMGTEAYRKEYGQDWAGVYGIRREGRWIVVYSPVDLCCSLEDDLDEDIVGYRKEEAFRLFANVIHYALSP